MMPQYYNAGQTPWGIYLATPVAPQTPQATPPGQPAAPLLRGQHAVTARPMPQMHATPGMFIVCIKGFLTLICMLLISVQCSDVGWAACKPFIL